jgi:plastocyanin
VTGTARFFWAPATVKIATGGTVTFAWSGNDFHDLQVPSMGVGHDPEKSASYTVTFPLAGSYAFSCAVHPDTMKGTVVVE